jgi:hypothetical protein
VPLERFESPGDALAVNLGEDGRGDLREKTEADAVADAAEDVLTSGPAEAEGGDAVVLKEWREEGDGDEGEAEVFGDVAAHVGLVDEEGVDVSGADGGRAVAEDHAGGVFYAFDGEAEGRETFELAELAI